MAAFSKRQRGFTLAGVAGLMLATGFMATASAAGYDQTNLISDGSTRALKTDPNLVNPWGVSFAPGGPFWVSDNGTGVTTLYDGQGAINPLVVNVPGPGGVSGTPTGQVFNGTTGFVVSKNATSGPALFIFVNEDGAISGWNPSVDLHNAVLESDNSHPGQADAVYKGAALATFNGQTYLYAADFHNGRITVFDSNWTNVSAKFAFNDSAIPKGFAPFNITPIGNYLYVSYALQDADKHDDVRGSGHGFIDVYGVNGKFHRRFATHGHLNSPWGMVVAPKTGFGQFSGRLLVGNFGDGSISGYNITSGDFVGSLADSHGATIHLRSLWALSFGPVKNQVPNTLYFTAGLKDEGGGLFGGLTKH